VTAHTIVGVSGVAKGRAGGRSAPGGFYWGGTMGYSVGYKPVQDLLK